MVCKCKSCKAQASRYNNVFEAAAVAIGGIIIIIVIIIIIIIISCNIDTNNKNIIIN